ncbi:MAG: isoprenyl transferase [bacterium]|nr:isoprenyl transferase [bacterium]
MGDTINEKGLRVPNHVAVILDGNGRWAKKRLMPRNYGHKQGSKNVEKMCEVAWNLGIKYFTVYAFSTENWGRPQEEVDELMRLLRNYMLDCIERTSKNNMRVRIIGDKKGLPEDLQESIRILEEKSSVNTGLNFTIALNYGSRDEITRAVKEIAEECKENNIQVEDITSQMISEHLDTKDMPDPDLLIRTSGEQRLSNYLLWQLAYTEFYFTDVLWPDFDKKQLEKAIEYYNGRDRRFGKI